MKELLFIKCKFHQIHVVHRTPIIQGKGHNNISTTVDLISIHTQATSTDTRVHVYAHVNANVHENVQTPESQISYHIFFAGGGGGGNVVNVHVYNVELKSCIH